MNCILLSHTHVYPHELYKHDILDFSLKHYRKHHPNAYLILTGHGVRPSDKILENVDHVYWEDEVDASEIGKGHPRLVDIGVDHSMEKGFSFLLKNRADSIIVVSDIFEKCIQALQQERRELLVSYGTCAGKNWLGDLFTFCNPKVLNSSWDSKSWNYNTNGLENFGTGFYKYISPEDTGKSWIKFLREHVVYRSPDSLGWVDLLGPHPHKEGKLKLLKKQYSEQDLLDNKFDPSPYVWGKDWVHKDPAYVTEDFFYNVQL
tara:strand:- start:1454 stop:2236 length:783 start_codon:yes stop_codon:yes gene_type:complete